MKAKWSQIFSVAGLLLSTQAFAQSQSPYLKLYQARLEAAEQSVEEAQISLEFENKSLARLRPLLDQGIISQQRFEEQSIKVEVAKLNVDNLRAQASQAEALFEVNKLRIDNGLEVPVCPEGE
jgi:multidrug resistance efflux pump